MLEEELMLFSFVKEGVRARKTMGGAAVPLPKFTSPPFFGGNKIKLGRRQFLKTFSCFFYYYYFIIFYVFKLLT